MYLMQWKLTLNILTIILPSVSCVNTLMGANNQVIVCMFVWYWNGGRVYIKQKQKKIQNKTLKIQNQNQNKNQNQVNPTKNISYKNKRKQKNNKKLKKTWALTELAKTKLSCSMAKHFW